MKRNRNLRILCLAYANGRIDRRKYKKLMAMQLSAIEFGKPYPELPIDLSNINVPKKKIELARGKKSNRGLLFLGAFLLLGLLGSAAAFVIYSKNLADQNTTPKINAEDIKSVQSVSRTLLEGNLSNTEDIQWLTERWNALSEAQRVKYRKTPWHASLTQKMDKIILTLTRTKTAKGLTPISERRLAALLALREQWSAAQAHTKPTEVIEPIAPATPQEETPLGNQAPADQSPNNAATPIAAQEPISESAPMPSEPETNETETPTEPQRPPIPIEEKAPEQPFPEEPIQPQEPLAQEQHMDNESSNLSGETTDIYESVPNNTDTASPPDEGTVSVTPITTVPDTSVQQTIEQQTAVGTPALEPNVTGNTEAPNDKSIEQPTYMDDAEIKKEQKPQPKLNIGEGSTEHLLENTLGL